MNIRAKIKKLLKESDRQNNLKDFIVDNIDFDGYDIRPTKNPLKTGLEIFMNEYDFEIKRRGMKRAFIEYLKGLPSWINLPYSYYDIEHLMYALGYDEIKDKNMEDDEIANLFYNEVANIFLDSII